MLHSHKTEYYLGILKNETQVHAAIWMNLANISFCFYGPFNEILILFS
jgi:hypothetical protein